ncbi:universal stress protein [Ornithinibacillus scapharcae]|uniref:universal stress protein n=1 Tax=Ornithinibacillus scapharcae TaxID=1147159 RepID=UPI000225BBDB|nr:universal stress protein [Ornithinibacillus scapharcae]
MIGFKHILLAFDGSEYSVRALQTAEHIAKLSKAKLTVAYVHEPNLDTSFRPALTRVQDQGVMHTEIGTIPVPSTEPARNDLEQTHYEDNTPDHILSDAKLRLSNLDEVIYEVLAGKPSEEIAKLAKEEDMDLIIMGNRGISGFKKFVMGSVSRKVMDEAECPVLVIK